MPEQRCHMCHGTGKAIGVHDVSDLYENDPEQSPAMQKIIANYELFDNYMDELESLHNDVAREHRANPDLWDSRDAERLDIAIAIAREWYQLQESKDGP